MLQRGLTDALNRGDQAKAGKYRKALADLPEHGVAVREEGEKIVLETGGADGIVPPLPPLKDAKDSPNEGFDPTEVLSGIRAVRPAKSESLGLAREIRTDREAQSLSAWADERGILATRSHPPRSDDLTGGEHFVEINEDLGLVFKSTHPGKFGFAADVEMIHPNGWKAKPRITAGLADATPEEYLFRLEMQNKLFDDHIRVIGAVRFPQGLSVLSSQPFYNGSRTEQSIINAWFTDKGWSMLPSKEGAFYNSQSGLLIMDALPRNVLTLDSGEIMPFDVVIVSPPTTLKSKLGI